MRCWLCWSLALAAVVLTGQAPRPKQPAGAANAAAQQPQVPDLRVDAAVGVEPGNRIQVQISNIGRGPSADDAVIVVNSRSFKAPQPLRLPALRPGEAKVFMIPLPVDPAKLKAAAKQTPIPVTVAVQYQRPELSRNNNQATVNLAGPLRPAPETAAPAPATTPNTEPAVEPVAQAPQPAVTGQAGPIRPVEKTPAKAVAPETKLAPPAAEPAIEGPKLIDPTTGEAP